MSDDLLATYVRWSLYAGAVSATVLNIALAVLSWPWWSEFGAALALGVGYVAAANAVGRHLADELFVREGVSRGSRRPHRR